MPPVLQQSRFRLAKMDCPSEEQLVRLQLAGMRSVVALDFDLAARCVQITHDGSYRPVWQALVRLNLGAEYLGSRVVPAPVATAADGATARQRRLLWQVLLINLLLFVLEMVAGWWAQSMGLLADGLDMLADAAVYGLALSAVGAGVIRQQQVARSAGVLQAALAVWGLVEVWRRFLGWEGMPVFEIMMAAAALALVGNSACLYLLHRQQDGGAHMRASVIFTANDVWVNLGVILAGVLTHVSQSKYPDLLVGMVVFVLVAQGARRIWRLADTP